MGEFLLKLIVYGAASAGLAAFLQALPWPAAWRQRKPLSCAVCSVGWCLIGIALLLRYWPGWETALLAFPGTLAIGLWFYLHVRPPDVAL